MFGGDAVERKFGKTPPPEWVATTGYLKDHELDRGMRRLLHSGANGVPTLPAFVKLCRTIGDDMEGDVQRPKLPAPDPWDDKPWLAAANRHLLRHLVTRLMGDPHRYGAGITSGALRMSDADIRKAGLDSKKLDASPEFIANVELLVQAKNAWADEMAEFAGKGTISVEVQKQRWAHYLDRAEAEIDDRLSVRQGFFILGRNAMTREPQLQLSVMSITQRCVGRGAA